MNPCSCETTEEGLYDEVYLLGEGRSWDIEQLYGLDLLRKHEYEHAWRILYDPYYSLSYWDRRKDKANTIINDSRYPQRYRDSEADSLEESEMHLRWIKDLLWLRDTIKTWPKGKVTVKSKVKTILSLFGNEDLEEAA